MSSSSSFLSPDFLSIFRAFPFSVCFPTCACIHLILKTRRKDIPETCKLPFWKYKFMSDCERKVARREFFSSPSKKSRMHLHEVIIKSEYKDVHMFLSWIFPFLILSQTRCLFSRKANAFYAMCLRQRNERVCPEAPVNLITVSWIHFISKIGRTRSKLLCQAFILHLQIETIMFSCITTILTLVFLSFALP